MVLSGTLWYYVMPMDVHVRFYFHFVRFQNYRSISIYFVCFLTELISIVQQNRPFSKDTRFYFCWFLKRCFFHISERSVSFVHRFFSPKNFVRAKNQAHLQLCYVMLCGAMYTNLEFFNLNSDQRERERERGFNKNYF